MEMAIKFYSNCRSASQVSYVAVRRQTVARDSYRWLVEGGGGYILAGEGWWLVVDIFVWWWVVVDGGGWWWLVT